MLLEATNISGELVYNPAFERMAEVQTLCVEQSTIAEDAVATLTEDY